MSYAEKVASDSSEVAEVASRGGMQVDTLYPITITEVKFQRKPSGYSQLEIAMLDTETGKKLGRTWLTLPIYPADVAAKHDPINFQKMKDIAATNFYGFLSALFPDEFPAKLDGATKGKAAIEVAKEIAGETFELDPVGAEIYFVRVQGTKPDAKGELRTYDNFYATYDSVPAKFRPQGV